MATYKAGFFITRDGREVYRGSWFPEDIARSEEGFACDHDCRLARHYEEGQLPTSCEWCVGEGQNGALRPVQVVQCPNCEGVYLDDPSAGEGSFIEHLTDECGQ